MWLQVVQRYERSLATFLNAPGHAWSRQPKCGASSKRSKCRSPRRSADAVDWRSLAPAHFAARALTVLWAAAGVVGRADVAVACGFSDISRESVAPAPTSP